MSKKNSFTLGDHFESFIDRKIALGLFSNTNELIRSGFCQFEEQEQKGKAFIQALVAAERSGDAGEVDFAKIRQSARQAARQQAGISATDA